MEGIGVLVGLVLHVFDGIGLVCQALWFLLRGIPGVLRHGVGFWSSERRPQRRWNW